MVAYAEASGGVLFDYPSLYSSPSTSEGLKKPEEASQTSTPVPTTETVAPTKLLSIAIKKRRRLVSEKEQDLRKKLLLGVTIQKLCKHIGEQRAARKRKRSAENAAEDNLPSLSPPKRLSPDRITSLEDDIARISGPLGHFSQSPAPKRSRFQDDSKSEEIPFIGTANASTSYSPPKSEQEDEMMNTDESMDEYASSKPDDEPQVVPSIPKKKSSRASPSESMEFDPQDPFGLTEFFLSLSKLKSGQ